MAKRSLDEFRSLLFAGKKQDNGNAAKPVVEHDSDTTDKGGATAVVEPERRSPNPPPPRTAKPESRPADRAQDDEKLTDLLARINGMTSNSDGRPATAPASPRPATISRSQLPHREGESAKQAAASIPAASASITDTIPSAEEWAETSFVPREPMTIAEAGLTESSIEDLLVKFLMSRGESSGRDAALQVRLPFVIVNELLQRMKRDQLVYFRGSSEMNDYIYQLTDFGRERAKRLAEHCTYFGAAPVPLDQYISSVKAQTIQNQHPSREDLQRAFSDLLINQHMFDRLGPAVNSGRGMFLYGYPGNGKTSIAERVTAAFGKYVWIPRALSIDGEIMRLFDPMNHVEAPVESSTGLIDHYKVDRRWVRIRRPTIIAGGELTMESLEVTYSPQTGISEAPLQLKSNCGTLVIDDFGRQRMSTDELLNRWIVPLEKRYDFLNMSTGKKIQVPFDQLIIFSTNLEPKDLVDDAFLRRIPYKIEVPNPTEGEFRELFKIMCPIVGLEHRESTISHLIDSHYRPVDRPFRCCQPRDLLLQVRNYCLYQKIPVELKNEFFDYAVENYFAVMG